MGLIKSLFKIGFLKFIFWNHKIVIVYLTKAIINLIRLVQSLKYFLTKFNFVIRSLKFEIFFSRKTGLEPAVFDVTGRRFNQIKLHSLLSTLGFEPRTSGLKVQCSTN